jgi:hypothetical protein
VDTMEDLCPAEGSVVLALPPAISAVAPTILHGIVSGYTCHMKGIGLTHSFRPGSGYEVLCMRKAGSHLPYVMFV